MPNLSDLSFEDIRPYHNEEVNEVLKGVVEKPSFFELIQYLFPNLTAEQVVASFRKIHTTREFQAQYIHQAIRTMISSSISDLTFSGFENLDPQEPCLFISNHRDIILDSALLNVLLFEEGFETTQIAIGDNLMVSPLVTDLMKLNKSFVVFRNLSPQQLLAASDQLSHYIRHVITDRIDSVWIAQRGGRTKDGHDQTQPALLKMLMRSGDSDVSASLKPLKIVPMTVSYEYEPCDYLKVEELYHRDHDLPYQKDDKLAMVLGIREPKGRVHLEVGKPLGHELDGLSGNRNEQIREVCQILDQHIHRQYRLWPINWVAADLISGKNEFQAHYTEEDRAKFVQYVSNRIAHISGDSEALRERMYQLYAQPIFNSARR
ncbi:1-acyl-sn-glycerol-3-phosphate acyltransferase [Pontibacter sp. G13]|uniref:1-acyl-sn-glycerol-3-phosphate acyltransferase n=1 Tax=Pontibacter sp. G13 TaxID=3074898 RepID=UPI0028891217|nr:1-acyl-sn-glycerol-3-phosphate acyltransferase [Pontibacter sp. G13]WNJ18997.1 1-acyl-sn-glycerol-3-phosphate acyltransferase [Pontibacter sp. G13]